MVIGPAVVPREFTVAPQHLVEYLPQLHSFLKAIGTKVAQEDKATMYEAIAFVISAMPMDQAAQTLREFSLDILALVHAAASKPTMAIGQELKAAIGTNRLLNSFDLSSSCAADGLENLEVMLSVVQTFGDDLPAACRNTCQEAWLFFDPFIAKYGSDYNACERVTRVVRFALNFFGSAALPVIPAVLARLSAAFEETAYASYLWIIGKIVSRFGREEDPALQSAFKRAFEQTSNKLVKVLQNTPPNQIPDGEKQFLAAESVLMLMSYSDGGLPSYAH